jgi:hypothetical protein
VAAGPLNPGNWWKREIRPKALGLGLALGGWHDLSHSCSTNLRRQGVHPKLVSQGHSKVQLALDVYDHAGTEEPRDPLRQLNPLAPTTAAND